MSDIDFQNGFICGMATKGLTRSGQLYKPLIWNDEGVYTYFYIDFRRGVEDFSTGMWNESVVIHDSEQIKATAVQFVSTGIYKIFCDITDRPHGITVLNKKVSRLQFSTGERLPVFSIHMFILGQPQYLDAGYVYDKYIYENLDCELEETVSATFWDSNSYEYSETIDYPEETFTVSETASVVLT